MTYRHIACCVAPAAGVRAAVAEASRLRIGGPGRLSLVHVVRWPPTPTERRPRERIVGEAWRWLCGECAPVRGAEAVLLLGADPAEVVGRWADGVGVDLIVAGADTAAAERTGAGGFAARLARLAPCPVLVARGGRRAGQDGPYMPAAASGGSPDAAPGAGAETHPTNGRATGEPT